MNQPRILPPLCLLWIGWVLALGAAQTESVVHDSYADFLRGEPKGLAVTDQGLLTLSPQWRVLADTEQPILWAVVAEADGTLYAGGGNEGRVFRITADGVVTQWFKADEIEVHALARDGRGNLYVGSSPDGKVYRVGADGSAETFFDPKQKYIWALTCDGDGNLFVATGDKGLIYKVLPDGQGQVYFDSDEANVTCLHWSPAGVLLAGTDPGGYLYRLTPPAAGATNATAVVVFDAREKEIRSLAAAADGSLYAAAVGEGGKEGTVYRVHPDGYAEAIWTGKELAPYALWLRTEGNLFVGTGEKGMLLSVSPRGETTTLFQSDAAQITALLSPDGRRLIAATSNPGTLLEVLPQMAREGWFDSEVVDSRLFADWGHLRAVGELPAGGGVELLARSGNTAKPEKTWTPWQTVATALDGGPIPCPPARYIQYRVKLLSSDGKTSPTVDRVQLFYQPRNAAPKFTLLEVLEPGFALEKVPPPPPPQQTSLGALLGVEKDKKEKKDPSPALSSSQVRVTERRGLRTVVWKAEDPNRDRLRFSVRYRAEGDPTWRLLEDKLEESYYSWDSTAWADGVYFLLVEATDEADNPPGSALQTREISRAFLVDNTAPALTITETALRQARATVVFEAADATSRIAQAAFSVNGRDWQMLLPEDRVFDHRREIFRLTTPDLPSGTHKILMRAADEMGNAVAADVTVTVP